MDWADNGRYGSSEDMVEGEMQAREHEAIPGPRRWRGYGLAVVLAAVAALVRLALEGVVGDLPPYITFYPVVLAAAVAGGTGPGMVATLLSALAVVIMFFDPVGTLKIVTPGDVVGVILFIAINLAISVVGGRIWREMRDREAAQKQARASESRLRTVVESLQEGVVVFDLEGKVLHWNQAALELHGFSRVEADRRWDLRELAEQFELSRLDGTVWPLEQWPISRILRGEELRECEVRIRHRREDWQRVFSYGGSLIREGEGRPLIAVVTLSDITERKRAEEGLRQSEEWFRTITDAIPQLAWVARMDGYIFWFNRRCCEYTGSTPEQLEGWGWQSLVDPQVWPQVRELWRSTIATGQPATMEFPLRGADGRFRPFLTRVMPLKDNAGRVAMWFGTNTDITEQKQAQEELRRLKDELELRVEQRTAELAAVNRELNDFASIVAHDLKAPLRGVATIASWLQSGYADKLDQKGRERLAQMNQRVGRMDRMIGEILEYSRLGRAVEEAKPVALAELVPLVAQDLAPPTYAHIRIAPGLPVVQGEPVRLRQVFQNLIGNALKYADKSEVDIRVDWTDVGAWWEFCVTDNGPGIAERHHERIFKMFQTLAPKDRTDSTGVGLPLVKRIVERAGGRVWVESRQGEGSTFHFTWPKKPGGRAVERMAA